MLGRISSKQSWSMPDIRRAAGGSAASMPAGMKGGKLKAIEDSARFASESRTAMSRMDQSHKRRYSSKHTDSDRGGAGNLMSLDYSDFAKSKPGHTMLRGRAPSRSHPGAARNTGFKDRHVRSFDLEWAGNTAPESRPMRSSYGGGTSQNNSDRQLSTDSYFFGGSGGSNNNNKRSGVVNQFPLRNQPVNVSDHVSQLGHFSSNHPSVREDRRRFNNQPSQTRVMSGRASKLDGVTFGTGDNEHDGRRVEHRFNIGNLRRSRDPF